MSERAVDMRLACPAIGCDNTTVYNWVHSTDQGKLRITNKGNIFCIHCSTKDHMKNWYFACYKHPGDYRKTLSTTFNMALTWVLRLEEDIDVDFVIELSNYMKKNKY